MYFILMRIQLARNFKLADIKFGTVCFTNKSPWIWYYEKKEMLDRQQMVVNSTVCPYVFGSVPLNVTMVG
jgi:hypothetical protein